MLLETLSQFARYCINWPFFVCLCCRFCRNCL